MAPLPTLKTHDTPEKKKGGTMFKYSLDELVKYLVLADWVKGFAPQVIKALLQTSPKFRSALEEIVPIGPPGPIGPTELSLDTLRQAREALNSPGHSKNSIVTSGAFCVKCQADTRDRCICDNNYDTGGC